jgi:Protein of unknown function (DUF3551)
MALEPPTIQPPRIVARAGKTQQDLHSFRARTPHISTVNATGATPSGQGIMTMFKQVRRPQTALALLALTGLMLSYAGSARAEQKEAWCANYSDQSRNCGFATLAQCEADISGVGGVCSRNPASY